jgi:hypothetical protein
MNRYSLVALCGLVLWASPTRSLPQAKEDSPLQAVRVVGTMRTLNTAEYAYKHGNADHKFGSKDEIAEFLRAEGKDSPSLMEIENPAPCEIDIATTADGSHYWITIKPAPDKDTHISPCGFAAFSDDMGVIYTGKALGCEEDK